MKRSQNARKMKAIARAVSKNEKSEEKIQKAKSKKTRIQSAKSLYDWIFSTKQNFVYPYISSL